MRVDEEGRNNIWNIPAIKAKTRTVAGRQEKSPLSDSASELHLGKEKEKGKVRRW